MDWISSDEGFYFVKTLVKGTVQEEKDKRCSWIPGINSYPPHR